MRLVPKTSALDHSATLPRFFDGRRPSCRRCCCSVVQATDHITSQVTVTATGGSTAPAHLTSPGSTDRSTDDIISAAVRHGPLFEPRTSGLRVRSEDRGAAPGREGPRRGPRPLIKCDGTGDEPDASACSALRLARGTYPAQDSIVAARPRRGQATLPYPHYELIFRLLLKITVGMGLSRSLDSYF